jgi:DNA (cytosine-5)-methyltransferase 1
MPQRRRRVYILAYRSTTQEFARLKKNPRLWLAKDGIMPHAFPVEKCDANLANEFTLSSAQEMTVSFNAGGKPSPFENSGVMITGTVFTMKARPTYKGKSVLLRDILEPDSSVPLEFFISPSQLKQWRLLKGGKKEKRRTKAGFEYDYSEGPVAFPDHLDRPSRTIVTGEGGSTPSRFKHVVETASGKYRRLMPIELERLNMFPPNHTAGPSDNARAFFMGNALVVGIVERLGKELLRRASS